MDVTCETCGTEFDTERETASPGASGERCPSCGTVADVDETDAGDDGELVVEHGGKEVHIHVHLH